MDELGFRATLDHEESHWWFRSRRDVIAAQLARAAAEIGRPLRLLDFGCGSGRNLPLLAVHGEAFGADPEIEQWGAKDDPRRIAMDALSSQRFDVVTAFDVLEHLDDDVGGLRMLRGLVTEGGQLLLTVPAHPVLWGDEDLVSHHRRRYTRTSLVAACTAAGLRVRFVSHFNLSVLPAQALVTWAGRLRRALRPDTPPQSHVAPASPFVDELLYRVTSWEGTRVGAERWALPAGGSIVCRLAIA